MADEMSVSEIAERLGELSNAIRKQGERMDARFDAVDARLDKVDHRLDKLAEKADLGLEAHDILRDSMERHFEATHKKLDEGLELLKQVALHTTGRVQRLETPRRRRG